MRQIVWDKPGRFLPWAARINRAPLLARGLPPGVTLRMRVRWPLALLGIALLAQVLMPDAIWTMTAVALLILYLSCWLWARALARGLRCERRSQGSFLVVGDALTEEFVLSNASGAAAVWVEFADDSSLPEYHPGRIAGLSPHGHFRWRATAICKQRGLYRLGPHRLLTADPLHLFEVTLAADASAETILVYPRVVELPPFPLPRGYTSGDVRSRRPLSGSEPAMSVRTYLPDDDLRYVHWPSSARRAQLMVREMEQEPAGDIWILPDASASARRVQGDADTLETTVTAAASLAAQFLERRDGRAVGLLVASGEPERLVGEPPQPSRPHLWRLLADLAPVRPAAAPLEGVLREARNLAGSRSSLVVITAQLHDRLALDGWLAQVVRLHERGLSSAVLLVTTRETESVASEVASLLARHRIPCQQLPVDAPLRPLLTHRRRRTEYRSTPSGGVVAVEVEEEVA